MKMSETWSLPRITKSVYKVRFSDPEKRITYIAGFATARTANAMTDWTNRKSNALGGSGLRAEFLGKETSHTYQTKILDKE